MSCILVFVNAIQMLSNVLHILGHFKKGLLPPYNNFQIQAMVPQHTSSFRLVILIGFWIQTKMWLWPLAISVQIRGWWSRVHHGLWQRLLSSYQNNHKRASEELSHVNAKSATILSSFSVKDIHSSCVRIPFHQFAPNQVTKSRAEEMGRNSGIIPREFLFLVWLGTFRFRLWSKTSN